MIQAGFEGTLLIVLTWAALLSVRAGLFDVALEAKFSAGIVATFFGWKLCPDVLKGNLLIAGLGCAVVRAFAAGVIGKIYGWLAAKNKLDPIVLGVALNGSVIPLAAWAFSAWYRPWVASGTSGRNLSRRLTDMNFDQSSAAIAMLLAALVISALLAWWVNGTARGSRLIASGLSSSAASEAGVDVQKVRATASVWSGCACGVAGAFYVYFISPSSYSIDSTMGRGFLALAVSLTARRGVFLVSCLAFALGALGTVSQTVFRDILEGKIPESNIGLIAQATPYCVVLLLLAIVHVAVRRYRTTSAR